MFNKHREKQCAPRQSLCFKAKQMRHDAAPCEMILTCQLVVGNWADLHANGLRLLNNVGESGTITRGDVHRFYFVLDFPELKKHFDFVCALYTVTEIKMCFQLITYCG